MRRMDLDDAFDVTQDERGCLRLIGIMVRAAEPDFAVLDRFVISRSHDFDASHFLAFIKV